MTVVLIVVAEHFVAGKEAVADCAAKGIEAGGNEGSCTERGTTLVVVDRHSTLKLASMDARITDVDARKTLKGPLGSRTAPGLFVVFHLAITNLTDARAAVGAGQCVLYLNEVIDEAVEAEEGFEPGSFLRRDEEIPPRGTEDGTVVFSIGTKRVPKLRDDGNLDFLNLGKSVPPLEPEAIFSAAEYGVIRLYQ